MVWLLLYMIKQKILAATIAGNKKDPYNGSVLASKLKIMGVDVFSAGMIKEEDPSCEVVKYEDPTLGIYKKCVVKEGKLIGTILLGDATDANRLLEFIRDEKELGDARQTLLSPPRIRGTTEKEPFF